jgi:superfamily II DNA/RNA helicase
MFNRKYDDTNTNTNTNYKNYKNYRNYTKYEDTKYENTNTNYRNYEDTNRSTKYENTNSNYRNYEDTNRNYENTKYENTNSNYRNYEDTKELKTEETELETEIELETETENIPIFNSWDDFDLEPNLLRSIYAHGFEKPSTIQSKAIYPIMQGKDIIAQSQSGTGKTGAFTIGALSKVNINEKTNQVLIIAPTHELSYQITSVVRNLSAMMKGIEVKTIVGGSSLNMDAYDMQHVTPHIIVGCPGRIYDMIKRTYINVKTLKLIIVDEADEMFSKGFKEQLWDIFNTLNEKTQIALFSATLSNNINQIITHFMKQPIKIYVKSENLTLEGIKQYFVAINDDRDKYETLKDLYQIMSVSQCIIYANSVKRVIDLYEAMKDDGFPVCCIHSNMLSKEREQVFKEFKTGASRVLISTNVTSRGIDIQQVSVVINFDLPKDIHNYLHRIGRSGRWGRKGTGINLITKRDIEKLKEIEKYYCTQIDELPSIDSL